MKKWTIILIVMLTVLNFGSFVLADEIDENTEVLANDGRVIMNFIDENYSPVVGASVRINLSTDNGMIDIRELGLNTVIVLESDQNGIVVINDLPYGFYEYYVDYVPLGYECLYTASNFFVSPAEDVAYVNVMFKEDVAMVAAPIEEVVKEEMEEEEEKEEVVVPVYRNYYFFFFFFLFHLFFYHFLNRSSYHCNIFFKHNIYICYIFCRAYKKIRCSI